MRKLRLFIFIIVPFLILYLSFVFAQFNFNPFNWGEDNRAGFIMILLLTYSCIFLIYGGILNDKNKTLIDAFTYNKLEEMEKRNQEIRELNRLSKEQLELLKENDNYRQQAKEFVGKNKIF